ncbi:uncharacterized protein LOC131995940 [Stomoxys calcitrans]|uniref:uncharacterized protein LOC131995940 n=1 Tax=Stomoxys calcitrans TaxID=35570 RepID=UPI0027E2F01E|nr:uncharacterized protein LOC131995940 [Stomoxys calcitrans]
MSQTKKNDWKCHVCKPRKSPNNIYKTFVFGDTNTNQSSESPKNIEKQHKQQRVDDETNNNNTKRFKETEASSTVNTQNDIAELKNGMVDLKSTMQQIVMSLSSLSSDLKNHMDSALAEMNKNVATIAAQVCELQRKDEEKAAKINELTKRVQQLEQKSIENNIEINNVENMEIETEVIVKRIADALGVDMTSEHMSKAYKIKRKNKIIVEFATHHKKKEIMSKLKGHRIHASVVRGEENSEGDDYVYINDELTPHIRRILWAAKTKAKENEWKFIWIRNGHIYARKNEKSPFIIINNASDLELITKSI